MKRMITQELIDKIEALFGNIIASADQITIMSKLHLLDVADLEISDLGALFPTAENGKFLRWSNGVLENSDIPEISPSVEVIQFTEDDWDDEENIYKKEIPNLSENKIYSILIIADPIHTGVSFAIDSPKLISIANISTNLNTFIQGHMDFHTDITFQIINGCVFEVMLEL